MDFKDDEDSRTKLLALLITMPEHQRECFLAAMEAQKRGEITFELIDRASKAGELFTETDPARFVERIRAAERRNRARRMARASSAHEFPDPPPTS